jgi:hypothetical protein
MGEGTEGVALMTDSYKTIAKVRELLKKHDIRVLTVQEPGGAARIRRDQETVRPTKTGGIDQAVRNTATQERNGPQ